MLTLPQTQNFDFVVFVFNRYVTLFLAIFTQMKQHIKISLFLIVKHVQLNIIIDVSVNLCA